MNGNDGVLNRLTLRNVSDDDLPALLVMNQAAVPHVGSIDLDKMLQYKRIASYFTVAWLDGQRAGFLIAMTPDADYASPNFQWFVSRYSRFFYIDRVVVVPQYYRLGIGRRLYKDVLRPAAEFGLLSCEVNLLPPNERSMAFHQAMGFEAQGSMDSDEGRKRVCFMTAAVLSTTR